MFVQLIEGHVSDADALRRQYEEWVRELSADADGWQGLTGGVADDGHAFMAARFASEEQARANSDRPAQGAWWAETEACYDGKVTFTDCTDVEVLQGDGGSDDAGFVQVIKGRMADPAAARAEMDAAMEAEGWRPDVVGAWLAEHGDGSYTQVVYFTSEEEARAGEAANGDEFAERMMALHDGAPTFLDLRDPWLHSA
ncbi:hypothetical protein [Salsipaludibacter albus]|uniref:hypothetical protein n=1 Tax=Salsipaludibacter albus TaxID=2849650 RepID=UPI001EE3F4B9|nr:hypothetical protein [Salsipaludibacter albus]MBY5164186.1 hypothetical protein [Salsipaludibacter albus]